MEVPEHYIYDHHLAQLLGVLPSSVSVPGLYLALCHSWASSVSLPGPLPNSVSLYPSLRHFQSPWPKVTFTDFLISGAGEL